MKSRTNTSLRPDLVRRAKELQLNLSEIFERALEDKIREVERQRWLEDNSDAIDAYNARVAERGVFSDGRRRF